MIGILLGSVIELLIFRTSFQLKSSRRSFVRNPTTSLSSIIYVIILYLISIYYTSIICCVGILARRQLEPNQQAAINTFVIKIMLNIRKTALKHLDVKNEAIPPPTSL